MTDISKILLNAALPGAGLVAEAVVPLVQRLGIQDAKGISGIQGTQSTVRPDPEFDAFYNEFIAWAADGPGKKAIVDYLKQYTNGAGEKIYHTTQYQQDVLVKIMQRMKAEGLEGEDIYKELSGAFASVSAAHMFFQEFLQDVFKTEEDEDSRENVDW
ncbi:hypothetical protein [Pseudomonas sp. 65/3-MNA-CIBAN-0223]|uniref:hypothetical protein n=1 Tax=Pseudomonas sp. 65/3-MNA-CIBAN-0223 TaxID=3140476 RepID=UPI0033313F89